MRRDDLTKFTRSNPFPLPPEGGGREGGSLKRVLLLLALLLLVSGCGYHAVVPHGPLAEGNGVNVVMFANKSYRSGIEGVLGRELVREFALRTGGRVLPDGEADQELTGAVLSYQTVPISYTALDTIKEYKAVVTVQAVLREVRTKKVLWKGDLVGEQSFPVNDNIALQQNAEEAAIAAVARKLSEGIWQQLSERF